MLSKDPYKINLLLTILFAIGIAVSAFLLFRLPYNLGMEFNTAFTVVNSVVIITFIIGLITISQAMRYRKELIVYREKTTEQTAAEQATSENRSTITMDGVIAALANVTSKKDAMQKAIDAICSQLEAGQGAVYTVMNDGASKFAELTAGFALMVNEEAATRFSFGDGLVGQVAASGKMVYLDEMPEGYIKIISGLGSASPRYLLILPVKKENQVLAILEIATFLPITEDRRKFVEQGAQLLAEKLSH